MKKRILLISDVKNWGGWVRGEYIKKYLSDEFHIELMDQMEFKNHVEGGEVNGLFDLYYPLFHTMLTKKSVKEIIEQGKKVITIVTGFPTIKPCFIPKEGINRFEKLSRGCSALLANNIISLNDLNKVKPEATPTYYCPRGVDENIFYPMDKDENRPFTVVYVGKPVKEKGLLDFIKPACEKVGVNLLINDRNYTDALGPNAMREFYNKADVYVVASTIDGTPNPALEAAACGVPLISNPIGNMPEFIKHRENGFIVNQMTINKYAYRIKWMMDHPIERKIMAEGARKSILEGWTWEKVLENERNVFREMLNG